MPTILDRFESHCEKTDSCWIWMASLDHKGYGRFSMNGKKYVAHRAAYILYKGKFAEELQVMHNCDNPCCVNPSHLTAGTHSDNMQDRHIKGRTAKGEGHCKTELTNTQVIQLKMMLRTGAHSQISLARSFNIGYRTVSDIARGRTWKEVA